MFRDVPGCSGMFRNVPECSMFWVLSTPRLYSRVRVSHLSDLKASKRKGSAMLAVLA